MPSERRGGPVLPYPCIESTVDITHARKTLRLWINQADVPTFIPAHRELVAELKESMRVASLPDLMAQVAAKVPGINAAQLFRGDPDDPEVRLGIMVYFVPFEDERKLVAMIQRHSQLLPLRGNNP